MPDQRYAVTTDVHVRALRFMGPILSEILKARAKRLRCGIADLATDEVSDYQDAILRGIQRTLDARLDPPDDVLSPDQRPTPLRPGPPFEIDQPRAPAGVYGDAVRPRSQTGRTTPSMVPPPASGPPFNDPLEETPAVSEEARRRKARRGQSR
jgi:hypothetical protein